MKFRFLAFALLISTASFVNAATVTDEETPRIVGINEVLGVALIFIEKGDLDAAQAIVDRTPQFAAAQEIGGVILALRGEPEKAIEAFDRAIRINPGQSSSMTKKGDVLRALGRGADARVEYEAALRSNPDDRHAHQRLGLMDEAAGDVPGAIGHFEKGIIGTAPDYVGVKANLALLYNRTGKFDQALALLSPYADGEDALLQRALANANLGLGQLDAAQVHYRNALKLAPDDRAAMIGLAMALTRGGTPDEAVALLDPVAAKNPADADVARALVESWIAGANTRRDAGDFADAEARLTALVARYPDSVEGLFQLASLYGLQQKYAEAVPLYEKAMAISPDNPALLRGAAWASLRSGSADKAVDLSSRLVARAGVQPEEQFFHGLVLEGAGKSADAEAAYRAALAQSPDHWPSLNNLAMLVAETDMTEALALAAKAASLAPDKPPVLDTLGGLQLRAGKGPEAEATLIRAVELAPDSASYTFHLAQAKAATGQTDAARELLAKALSLAPDDDLAERIRTFDQGL